jgi:uncharacterized protein YbjT (DUF2867 family)
VLNPHAPQLSDALAQVVDPVDIVFCCLGTTLRDAGSKAAFIQADYQLVVDTALTGLRLGAKHMLVVSAMGANPHSMFFYNRVKGEMEEALRAQPWTRLTILRPSMLLGDREQKGQMKRCWRHYSDCCRETGNLSMPMRWRKRC